jgi:endonuclease G
MNRGVWLLTEEILEYYRDIDDLLVIGGVIWGDNPEDDYFVQSHGVQTPDAFWKVIVRGDGQDEMVIAWVVPNSQDATKNNPDDFLVSTDEIENMPDEKIPVADDVKQYKPSQSCMIPGGCNQS